MFDHRAAPIAVGATQPFCYYSGRTTNHLLPVLANLSGRIGKSKKEWPEVYSLARDGSNPLAILRPAKAPDGLPVLK